MGQAILVRSQWGYHPDTRRVACPVTSDDGNIKVWDWQRGQEVSTLKDIGDPRGAVTPDGQYVLSARPTTRSRSGTGKKARRSARAERSQVRSWRWALTPDGAMPCRRRGDWTIKVWDWQQGKMVRAPAGRSGAVQCSGTDTRRTLCFISIGAQYDQSMGLGQEVLIATLLGKAQ